MWFHLVSIICLFPDLFWIVYTQECTMESSDCYPNGQTTVWWEIEGGSKANDFQKEAHPVEKIQNVLRSVDKDGNLFGKFVNASEKVTLIGPRSGELRMNSCEDRELCKLQHNFRVKPKWVGEGKDKMAIVHTEKHQIVLHIKACMSESEQDSSICVQNGKTSRPETACRQLKSTVGVLVYDESGDQLKRVDIEYPSACICAQILDKDAWIYEDNFL